MKRRYILPAVIVVLTIIVLVVARCTGIFHGKNKGNPEETDGNQSVGLTIEYNGQKYSYNTNLTNFLFMGIDNSDPLNRFSEPAHAGQSDALFLLTINRETQEVFILQINRNAMTDIDIYDTAGQVADTIPGQVTLQYAYGTGGTQSAWAATKTVSEMLYGIPIDGYFVMNLEGINRINDDIGGVDVTMPCDYTVIDPSMTEGATVHIIGEMAERFVRYRNHDEFNSVKDRMERQVLYITALMDKLCGGSMGEMYDIISPYFNDIIITNLETDEFQLMADYTYSDCRVDLLPGEMVDTERFEEYNLDQEALLEYIVSNYFN